MSTDVICDEASELSDALFDIVENVFCGDGDCEHFSDLQPATQRFISDILCESGLCDCPEGHPDDDEETP